MNVKPVVCYVCIFKTFPPLKTDNFSTSGKNLRSGVNSKLIFDKMFLALE